MSEAMKFMSSKRQQELVDAVKDAADLHLGGELATDAIAKVASERSFGENEARLMVEAFNTSKTLAHMRDARGSEKAASFDLADADQVISFMFPKSEAVKAAFAVEEYAFSPRIPNYFEQEVRSALSEKVATVLIESQEGAPAKNGAEVTALSSTPSDIRYRKAYNACDYWRKKADAHRAEAAKMRGQIHEACRSIAESFRTPAGVGGWNTFAKEAEQLHGRDGRVVVDAIAEDFGLNSIMARHGAKEAAVTLPDPEAINHKLLKVAVLSIDAAADELDKEAKCREECAAAKARWFRSGGVDKKADLLEAMGAATLMGSGDKGTSSTSPAEVPMMQDVGVESEYNKARLQFELQDMLNEDDVISSHARQNPHAVLTVARELADIHPNLLNQPMALRAAIRRHLELGQTELHELDQIKSVADPLNIEKSKSLQRS